jgi:hypothetical protein
MQWQDTDSMREELDDLQVCDVVPLSVLTCRYGMVVMYNCLSCLGTVFVVRFLVFFFFFGSYGHN